jgi:hypothetical protein
MEASFTVPTAISDQLVPFDWFPLYIHYRLFALKKRDGGGEVAKA